MSIINKNFKKGFGIIEVLIASSIIAIILFALVATGRAALRNSTDMQERAQALFVAQEGMELVRQMRDTNWVDNKSTTQWKTMVSIDGNVMNDVNDNVAYAIKYLNTGTNGNYYLKPNSDKTLDQLVKVGNLETYRTVTINIGSGLGDLLPNVAGTSVLRDSAMKVTVNVSYGTKSVQVSEIMTNWRPDY